MPRTGDNWHKLVVDADNGMQGRGAVVEAIRREITTMEDHARSADRLGRKLIWLTLAITVFTVIVAGLTAYLVYKEAAA